MHVAFAAELEESAALALIGVCLEVGLFGEEGEDVEVLLKPALVVQVAEDLLRAGGGSRDDVLAAVGALGDLVGFEEAVPIFRSC